MDYNENDAFQRGSFKNLRSLGIETIKIVSTNKITATIKHVTCAALDGVEKNRRTTRSRPSVNVVYEKSKNPDPREYIPGGLTKMDTSNKTHQRKVMNTKNTLK